MRLFAVQRIPPSPLLRVEGSAFDASIKFITLNDFNRCARDLRDRRHVSPASVRLTDQTCRDIYVDSTCLSAGIGCDNKERVAWSRNAAGRREPECAVSLAKTALRRPADSAGRETDALAASDGDGCTGGQRNRQWRPRARATR